MKKKNKGIKIVLLILVLIIAGLLIYLIVDRIRNKPSEKVVKTSNEIKKINEDEEYIYDNPKYADKTIPLINLDSGDANIINEKIEKYVSSFNESTLDELSYNYYINGDIISLVITKKLGETDNKKYTVYTINVKTGEKVTNKEILKIKDKDLKEVSNILVEMIENNYGESLEFAKNSTVKTDTEVEMSIYDANKKTIEELKLENIKMYLNEKKELCVIFDTYTIAGPMSSEYIYNIDSKTIIKNSEK